MSRPSTCIDRPSSPVFQQVEDQIVTLRVLEQQAVIEDEAVKAAREAETLTLNQYKAGTVPYSSVITAQTTRLSAEQTALARAVEPPAIQRRLDRSRGRRAGVRRSCRCPE